MPFECLYRFMKSPNRQPPHQRKQRELSYAAVWESREAPSVDASTTQLASVDYIVPHARKADRVTTDHAICRPKTCEKSPTATWQLGLKLARPPALTPLAAYHTHSIAEMPNFI